MTDKDRNSASPSLMDRLRGAISGWRSQGPRAGEFEKITTPVDLLRELERGRLATSGVTVTAESAMRVSAVFACVKVISEDIASLPLHLYKATGDRNKDKATEHPIYEILHSRPNEWQTAMEFREMMQSHLLLRGNAYAIKSMVRGRLDELLPLHPDRVRIRIQTDGSPVYDVYPLSPGSTDAFSLSGGLPRTYHRGDILHIKGLSSNGYLGRSVLADARDAVGLAATQEGYASEAYRDGGLSRVALEHPASLSADASRRLRDSWVEVYGGAGRYSKPAVLEEGMKATKIGLTAQELQWLDGREFQIEDIARFFRVAPHKIGHLKRATNNNIEQLTLDHVTSTLRPWAVRWEQALERDLLKPADGYFVRHAFDGLLRGDPEKRHKAYATGRNWGYLSANDVRELEDMNPIEGGDSYLVPENMRDSKEPSRSSTEKPEPKEDRDGKEMTDA